MRVFVTGATGFIGTAVVADLVAAGHQALGLARSADAVPELTAAGAAAHVGTLSDLDGLRAAAESCDGVIHLAFNHDFSRYQAAVREEHDAIAAFGAALQDSGRPLVTVSGTLDVAGIGRLATENDMPDAGSASPRYANTRLALSFADRGVRVSVVRLAPLVHDATKCGFAQLLIGAARTAGSSGYLGDGENRWPAVHRLDAARLFRLAVEDAAPGSVLHGVGDEGVPIRAIAEAIGKHLNVPVAPVPDDQAEARFGFLAGALGTDNPTSNALTRQQLGWRPSHPGLLDDIDHGDYFASR
jgi:nucleoside-diphosphate-sugar epimerase